MNYSLLLDLATDLGYELAMNGAETFRVEDTIQHILKSYCIPGDVFAIPNYLMVSITTDSGEPITKMRRIGYHGNNLDSVERFNALSRRICAEKPDPAVAEQWLRETAQTPHQYRVPMAFLGDFLGASGFSLLFGCSIPEAFCAGLCGVVIGLVNQFMGSLKANPLFSTFSASFLMAMCAYTMSAIGIVQRVDAVNIGALMLLVPGLLFTNGLRDIIYGDTNSGINRIVQVLLIAVSLAVGTAFAWNVSARLFTIPSVPAGITYPLLIACIGSFVGCIGFSIIFNIHGPGMILCALGGVFSWGVFVVSQRLGSSELGAYFAATIVSATYAETMARIRKYPAISYLVVSIFPLIPGAGVYYAMQHALQNNISAFVSQGMYTAAIAGTMAVSILLVSTTVRMYTTWHNTK